MLERTFRDLQRKLHPDVVAQRPDSERRYGSAQSMAINAAYDTLRDPLQRALYLVRLTDVFISCSDSEIAL
jgi:molecular chaperone HscB